MPYILYKSNGQKLATIADGSIDRTTTDLTFVGKNYAGYGEILNQNLVKLLENFASASEPTHAIQGQLYYNTADKRLKIYDGSRFKPLSNLEVTESTKPATSVKGDLWFNEYEQKLYVYNGTKHVLVGPFVSEFSGVSLVPAIARTDNDLQKYVLKFTITDDFGKVVIAAVSRDEFTPNTADDLTVENFNIIKQGITLPGANPITGNSTSKGYYFWGTAAHALRLGDYAASEYALQTYVTGLINTDGLTIYNQKGLSIDNGFRVHYDAGNKEGKLSGEYDTDKISFNLVYTGSTTTILTLFGNTLIPNPLAQVNLGNTSNRFAQVWTNTATINQLYNNNASIVAATVTNAVITNLTVTGSFAGTLTGNVTGNITGDIIGQHKGNVVSLDGLTTLVNASTKVLSAPNANITNIYSSYIETAAAKVTTGNLEATTANLTTGNIPTVYTSHIYATGGGPGSAGIITGNWTLSAGSQMQATYADLAERYHADNEYEPGTVLIVGGDNEVTVTNIRGNTAVAGIVSSNPAYTMNTDAGPNETHPFVALKGRVPCKVVGPVKKGEHLVTSVHPGFACSAQLADNPKSIVGIALEDFDGDYGVIEVKV